MPQTPNDSQIIFEYENKHYSLEWAALYAERIVLPDRTLLQVGDWQVIDGVLQPSKFEVLTIDVALTRLAPSQIAQAFDAFVAEEVKAPHTETEVQS